MKQLPSRHVLCTPYNHAPCHFMQSHIRKLYACLAVTCHLHFWQNDRDLLRATAVTRGWNGYRNKSQHSKLTLEKKILTPLLQGFEPTTFQSWVRRSNHWAIPAPPNINSARVYWSAEVYNSAIALKCATVLECTLVLRCTIALECGVARPCLYLPDAYASALMQLR